VRDAKMVEAHVPCPPEALLAVGDLAAAAPPTDAAARWTQLYVYAFSVCEAVDSPWVTYRPAVAARAEHLERLRKQLEEMAR
jgi:hypothetical protein